MKTVLLFLFLSTYYFAFSNNTDSLQIIKIKNQVEQIENQVKEIRRDELNYKIEKDLIKDTYSNNYERISLVITIALGIIGLFGYLGLKDINSIKKEYASELGRLNELKTELENKVRLVSETQVKYEKEILEIIKQNEEQNKKIKLLELSGKISSLRSEKKYPAALEACLEALQIDPNSTSVLMHKGLIYSITRSYPEAIHAYSKILELEPDSEDAVLNLSEVYILNEQNEKSDKLIEQHKSYYNNEAGRQALRLFAVLKEFNSNNIDRLLEEINKQIDKSDLAEKKNRSDGWNLLESIDYVEHKEESKSKAIIKNYFEYVQGNIDGTTLVERLK